MSEIAIKVENLGKQYKIGGEKASYRTLRESLMEGVKAPFQRAAGLLRGESYSAAGLDRTIWALKDVNLEIKKEEVVGVIGPNGAGKSTLLKILSRITEPSEGRALIRGRVGSLLEVGTGFHPELTGRENIFLNGSILGMQREEIERKFDQIVAFSGIEKFIDTPVKHYSSGMYVRLAFSVAAHLEPEILLVDEVLAVGDAAFQKKCLGKMEDVASEGRTVLFISHNMISIRNLCGRVIWMENGNIVQNGDTFAVTEEYLQNSLRADSLSDVDALINSLPPDPVFRLHAIEIRQGGEPIDIVLNGKPLEVEIQYSVMERTTGLRVYFDLLDDNDILIRSFHDDDAGAVPTMEPGEYVSTATIPANLLAPRSYEIRVRGTIFNIRSCTGDGIRIPIIVEANSSRGYPQDTVRSKLQPIIPWQTKKILSK